MSDLNFITLYRGDTWIIPVRLTNPPVAPATVGTAFDLTGLTGSGHLLSGTTSIPIAASVQTTSNLLANGQLEFVIPASDTATIPGDGPSFNAFRTRFQIQTTDTAGNTVTRGVVNIRVMVA